MQGRGDLRVEGRFAGVRERDVRRGKGSFYGRKDFLEGKGKWKVKVLLVQEKGRYVGRDDD